MTRDQWLAEFCCALDDLTGWQFEPTEVRAEAVDAYRDWCDSAPRDAAWTVAATLGVAA